MQSLICEMYSLIYAFEMMIFNLLEGVYIFVLCVLIHLAEVQVCLTERVISFRGKWPTCLCL